MEKDNPQLFDQEMFNFGAYIILQDNKNQIVGSIGIEPNQEEKTIATINAFAVDKDCRGLGLGRFLLDFAIDLCKSLRFRTVVIQTYNKHSRGVRIMDAVRSLCHQNNFSLKESKLIEDFGEDTSIEFETYQLDV